MEAKKCNTNSLAKYIRIALSLAVIAFGIIYKNPVGVLGLLTLYTAVTGSCGSSVRLPRFTRKREFRLDHVEHVDREEE